MVNTIKFSQFGNVDLNNSTNLLVGVDSPTGGNNIKSELPIHWTTTTRPTTPSDGLIGYNETLGVPEFWDGVAWIQLSGGGGSVTQVNTGTGLTGGPIVTTGTISFAPIAAHSLWANNTGSIATPTVIPISTFLQSANNLSDLANDATARDNLFLSAARGTAGQVLTSNGAINPPTWQNTTGSGTVIPSNVNEIAHYPANGNSVQGLPTIADGFMATNGSGVPGWLSIASTLTKLGFNTSAIGSSGYYVLPGGLYVQWDTVSLPTGSGDTVTYPVVFPNAVLVVISSDSTTGGGSPCNSTAHQFVNNSTFLGFARSLVTGNYTASNYAYIAIGH